MNRAKRLALGLALAALAPLCSCSPPAFDVEGARDDFERFAGRWEGTYTSDESGRAGTVVFAIDPAGSGARGEVIMIPRGWGRPLTKADGHEAGDRPDLLHALRFHRMSLDGDRVAGTLEPYRDPDCGCDLETSFVGRLRRGVIAGTYRSRPLDGDEEITGVWRVERKP